MTFRLNIEDFRPILEKEVAVIVDENRRGVVLEEVMKADGGNTGTCRGSSIDSTGIT